MGVSSEFTWGIVSLYELVMAKVRTPEGDSNLIHNTIGVKQGYCLSWILFGLHIDEISDFLDKGGKRGASLAGIYISLLFYANDSPYSSRLIGSIVLC